MQSDFLKMIYFKRDTGFQIDLQEVDNWKLVWICNKIQLNDN